MFRLRNKLQVCDMYRKLCIRGMAPHRPISSRAYYLALISPLADSKAFVLKSQLTLEEFLLITLDFFHLAVLLGWFHLVFYFF